VDFASFIFNSDKMLDIKFDNFPILATERLMLRQPQHRDASEMYRLRSDKEVMKYIGKPLARSVDEMEAHIQKLNETYTNNDGIAWAITLKNSPEMIGIICYHKINKEHHRADIGYLLLPQYHGKGIMHETMEPVLRFAFQKMNLHSIEANVDELNIASIKLLEKNNFIREAHFKENYYFDGTFLDSVIYSLISKTRAS
jgi:ribosomal-protein-alanine N-acetyltransferase